MVTIKKMARVTRRSSGSMVPSVLDGNLVSNAELVWTAVRRQIESNATMTPLDGQPGYYWRGSVNGIINELWPTLTDGYLVSADDAEEVKLALNRYLRNSRNMVCRQRGMRSVPSIWWVSDKWSPVTTSTSQAKGAKASKDMPTEAPAGGSSSVFDVTKPAFSDVATNGTSFIDLTDDDDDDDDDEAKAEAEIEAESDAMYKCRKDGCDHKPFTLLRIRNRHEYQIHGLAIRPDGTVTTFDPRVRITDQEVEDAIILVLADNHPDELSVASITKVAKRLDPRVSKNNVYAAAQRLLDAGKIERGSKYSSYFQYYCLADESDVVVNENVVANNVTETVETTSDKANDVEATASDKAIESDVDKRLTELHAALDELGKLARSAQDTESLIEERNRLQDRIVELEAELERITSERDQYREQLQTIKSMFN